ncbi:peptidoglycan-recognition protein LB [Caerostris darwini]|uniref:Peptidoglycan-recognition protein LB n=1 Tax=Caerostris darwini TaxID=1538125 RepID=A0AAV4WIP1_9ARAC|nr:peptidoglycan-recognition protein LB [Caerostris darwini]
MRNRVKRSKFIPTATKMIKLLIVSILFSSGYSNVLPSSEISIVKRCIEVLQYVPSDFNHRSSSGCDDVEIVSRERWGARTSKSIEHMQTPVPHLFIHHTAMRECNDFESCSKMMRAIQNFHMDDRGWDDIGYNYLIGGDGRVYMGRGWQRVGAHTYGFNRNGIAFSLMGDFSNKLPSEEMLNTTKKLIKCAENGNYVMSDYKLHGHRDAGCTACPGNTLYEHIKEWPYFEGGPLPGYSCRGKK